MGCLDSLYHTRTALTDGCMVRLLMQGLMLSVSASRACEDDKGSSFYRGVGVRYMGIYVFMIFTGKH